MKHVTLYIDAKRTMEIGYELRSNGWIQGVDFDYAYYKAKYNDFSGSNWEPEIEKHAVFTFYNDSNASYFMLRWG